MIAASVPNVLSALQFLDYLGIGLFAVSGALLAAQKGHDFVTFVFFAVVTGVGGGTARDLFIGAPVFWFQENWMLMICVGAAALVWFAPVRFWGSKALLWFDALGIAVYATYGVAKALAYGGAPFPAFMVGVLNACAGGIVRDILAGEPSILLRSEIYVSAAALSAGLMVGLSIAGMPGLAAGALAALAGFGLRAAAITRGWALPQYRG